MFCFQCQETAKNSGCTVRGVCGKTDEVAKLQDLTVWLIKGVSFYGVKAREMGISDPEADLFVAQVLFSTIANANFDADRFAAMAEKALALRDGLKVKFEKAYQQANGAPFAGPLSDAAIWSPESGSVDELVQQGAEVGIMADPDLNEDVRSLRELLIYGLKGLAAYTDHAYVLEHENDALLPFLQEGLLITLDDGASVDDLVGMVLKCGEMGVQAMALLDQANTSTFGNPEPTQVNIGVKPGPAILVTGHDLRDLDELLQQTENKGVNVYTHGEMLPAHAYPAFKKYPHLVGNYGGSWWQQGKEFVKFGGAVLLTTNCLTPPKETYADRLFTTGLVGWPGVQHVAHRNGGQKDFGPIIAKALESDSPQELEQGTIPTGFAHAAVLGVADKVIEAVKSGAIKRFVVMAGCDGRQKSRSYFTELAQGLPDDSIILTAGCAKYRYNKLDLGDIGGIPRVLDAGQCNDSYSLVVIAQALAGAFGLDDINDLPVSYDIGWYEQKAVIVLLALLHLGVKKIRLGPTLPAFISPNVLNVLVENFEIKPTTTVENDLAAIAAGE
ncbi:MAG: hydroxylamine reductase [Chloroflexi bacterium]|nr:hydroxylamine reductase [Chloroflexota bacterium]